MEYKEFLEALKQKAHDELGYDKASMTFYPKGYTSDDPDTIDWINDINRRVVGVKGNGVLMDDFLVMETDIGGVISQQRVATRKMYRDAEKSGLDKAFRKISKLHHNIEKADVDPERLNKRITNDYNEIRDQMIVRPLNYALHKKDLDGAVYRKIGDFVLCVYQLIGNANHLLLTSKIKTSDLERWGMEKEKVIDDAIANTARIYPASVYDKRIGKETDFLSGNFTRENITMMGQIILSTLNTTNGAVAIFYPGVMEKMMKIMGGPFQVVFMNINDAMIFGEDDQMAYAFAQTAMEPSKFGEVLSGKMYLCDGKRLIPGIVVKQYKNGRIKLQ